MEDFQLLTDQPGYLVSFGLDHSALIKKSSCEETLEINFRHLYKRLTGRKKSSHNSIVVSSPSANISKATGVCHSDAPRPLFKSSNTFDSIIEKLERKYYHTSSIDDGEGDSMTSDGTDSVSSQMHTPDIDRGEKNSKKRKFQSDDYDYSDPFIDDTEELQEYEGAIAAKRNKALKKGYYVSSGDAGLNEHVEDTLKHTITSQLLPAAASSSTTKEKPKVTHSSSIKDKDTTTKESKDKSHIKDRGTLKSKASIAKSASLLSMEDKVSAESSHTIVLQPRNDAMDVDEARVHEASDLIKEKTDSIDSVIQQQGDLPLDTTTVDVENSADMKKSRPPISKPTWKPHSTLEIAMATFKASVETFGPSTLKKSSPFPNTLEQPLMNLHTAVLEFHDVKELNKSTGYYEFISGCMGSHFPVGRIKTNIARLVAKSTSSQMRFRLDERISEYLTALKAAIIPCPEEKKIQKRDGKLKDGTKESGMISGEDIDRSEVLEPDRIVAEQYEATEEKSDSQQIVACHELPVFVWYCKWTLLLRQRLVELLDITSEWAKSENEYRMKLVLADKKEMIPEEVIHLIFYF